ncbi:uncharacterized protein LOC142092285 isoform X1 [Calonectris borealis]|uniref:uncharacterized protein LOC142092285 isoform X1 n=1 Tax=Calonectris borealis TaxID=1323832 RepID=UPI003F4B2C13
MRLAGEQHGGAPGALPGGGGSGPRSSVRLASPLGGWGGVSCPLAARGWRDGKLQTARCGRLPVCWSPVAPGHPQAQSASWPLMRLHKPLQKERMRPGASYGNIGRCFFFPSFRGCTEDAVVCSCLGDAVDGTASGLRGLSLPGLAFLAASGRKGTGGALTGCGQGLPRLKLERPEKGGGQPSDRSYRRGREERRRKKRLKCQILPAVPRARAAVSPGPSGPCLPSYASRALPTPLLVPSVSHAAVFSFVLLPCTSSSILVSCSLSLFFFILCLCSVAHRCFFLFYLFVLICIRFFFPHNFSGLFSGFLLLSAPVCAVPCPCLLTSLSPFLPPYLFLSFCLFLSPSSCPSFPLPPCFCPAVCHWFFFLPLSARVLSLTLSLSFLQPVFSSLYSSASNASFSIF